MPHGDAIIIQASYVGDDAGPFNLFSQVNGFTQAFETGITKVQLELGFVSYHVPAGTTVVRVMSTSEDCTNYKDIDVDDAPSCPDRTLVFQICNENAIIDDNFDIYLNGVKIGEVDLNQNAQVGSVFIASNTPQIITQPDFPCPLGGMVAYFFDPALLSRTNEIQMVNTQNNGTGNLGTIGVRNYKIQGNTLIEPCVVDDFQYSGASGSNFNFTFNYTSCC